MVIQFRIKKELVTEELVNSVGSYTDRIIDSFVYNEELKLVKPSIWWTEQEYLKNDIYRTLNLFYFPFMHVVMFMKEFPDFELNMEQVIGHNGYYNRYDYHSEKLEWKPTEKVY